RFYTLLIELGIVRLAMTAASSGTSDGPASATRAREALAGSPLLAELKTYSSARRVLTHDQVTSPERLAALKEGAETSGFLGALEAARRIGQQVRAGRMARDALHALLQQWGLPTLHGSFKTLGLVDLLEVQEQQAVAAWQQAHLPPLHD